MSIAALMNTSGTIERYTETPVVGGGMRQTWAPVATVPMRINHSPATDDIAAPQTRRGTGAVDLYMAAGVDIRRDDRVQIDGIEVEVKSLVPPSIKSHHLKVTGELRQLGGPS